MRCAADIACEKHRAYRPLPRSSIRAAVRAPWQLCSAARGLPAAAAAAACADHQASNLSRSLAGWRCLAACAAAPRTRPHVRWTPRRRKEGIPSTQAARAAPFIGVECLSAHAPKPPKLLSLGNLVLCCEKPATTTVLLPMVEHDLVSLTWRGRPLFLPKSVQVRNLLFVETERARSDRPDRGLQPTTIRRTASDGRHGFRGPTLL